MTKKNSEYHIEYLNSLAVDFYRISVIRNGSSHVAKKVTNSSIKKTKFGEKIEIPFICLRNSLKN